MIMYFAGAEPENFNKLLHDCNVQNILVSAYSLNYKKDLKLYKKRFDNVLLDSGGFSARVRGVEIKVKDYANYINKNNIKLAFNLDTMSVKETLSNQRYLEKNTDAYIIPIYHYSDYISKKHRTLLDRFIDKYNYISIGGVAGMRLGTRAERLYDYTFSKAQNDVKVHGLGITGTRVLASYPFYSVDSTSWLGASRFGRSNYIKDNRVMKFQSKNRHYMYRSKNEINYYQKMEKTISDIWTMRGVEWLDQA